MLCGALICFVGCGSAEESGEEATPVVETSTESQNEAPPVEEEVAEESTDEVVLPPANCEGPNSVTKAVSTMDTYRANGPFDFSNVASAHGVLTKEGKRLTIGLSNMELDAGDIASVNYVPPTLTATDWILLVHFHNGPDPIVPGEYDPNSGYKQPFWLSTEIVVKKEGDENVGVILSLGPDQGMGVLSGFDGKSACGTFDVSRKENGAAGSFNVEVIER